MLSIWTDHEVIFVFANFNALIWHIQIFTNGDKAHVDQVLSRLGLEDCFEGIICFETLNPALEPIMDQLDGDSVQAEGDIEVDSQIGSNIVSSKTRILCKPSVEAIEAAIKIADVDPSKTVNTNALTTLCFYEILRLDISKLLWFPASQIFFDDSARNIASGKAAGLHTVIVSSWALVLLYTSWRRNLVDNPLIMVSSD